MRLRPSSGRPGSSPETESRRGGMYCWSCGYSLNGTDTSCRRCGAPPARLPSAGPGRDHGIRACTGCGYRGEGIGYFRRASHAALLVGATVLTYGVGGLVYWLVKRHESVCPSCGLSWKRSRAMGSQLSPGPGDTRAQPDEASYAREEPGREPASLSRRGARARSVSRPLPSSGMGRRVLGVVLALTSVLFLGLGLSAGEAVLGVFSLVFGLMGAASFGWGWSSRQRRREAILREMQGKVLQLARVQGGTLTATDVASELDLTLNGAERVLLSLDDGFRVRSDVTDEGLLVFEFPEIRWSGNQASERGRLDPPLSSGSGGPRRRRGAGSIGPEASSGEPEQFRPE